MLFANARPLGHFAAHQTKAAAAALGMLQVQLGAAKRHALAEPYLDVLNKMLEPLAIVQGLAGLRAWLGEVQALMGLLKQRSFGGVPLTPRERQVLLWYSARWREMRGGPCDMGRPEAQLVLIALGELAMF
ncbi:hypothetical protein Q5752_005313 [Cryptotrichosporon argae]